MTQMILLLLKNVSAVTAVEDSHPSSSPDGGRIICESSRSGRGALWVANSLNEVVRQPFPLNRSAADPIRGRDCPRAWSNGSLRRPRARAYAPEAFA